MDYSDIMTASATDEAFRTELVADPRTVLTAHGFAIPDGLRVRCEEPEGNEFVLVLPPAIPDDVDLDDDALASVSGGTTPIPIATAVAGLFGLGGVAGGYELIKHV